MRLARLFHQPSTAASDVSALTALDSIGPTQRSDNYASRDLNRLPGDHSHPRRFVTTAGKKAGPGFVLKIICWNLAVLFTWTQLAIAAPTSRENFFSRKRHDYQATTQRNQELLTRKKVLQPASFAEPRSEGSSRTHTASINATYGLSHLADLTEFSLPEKLGRITEVYNPPGVSPDQRRLVIQIQDLHTHPGAQRNLVGVLMYLREHYDLPVVCSEGAGGRLHTDAFSQFPFPSIREQVADRLLEAGELTGEEFLAMTTDPTLPIEGIEDAATYFPNLLAFHEVMAEHDGSQLLVNQLKAGLDALKPELWNAELLQLDEDRQAYERGTLAPHEYVAKLSALAQAQGVPMQARYDEVYRLQQLLRLEGQIDQARVQYETSRLLKGLSSSTLGTPMARSAIKPLMVAAAALEQGRVNPHTFYKRLAETAERLEPQWRTAAPAVAAFSDYLGLANRLDITAVYTQLDALYREVQGHLAPTDVARELAEHQHRLNIFEGLINLRVSNDQYDEFQRAQEHYSVDAFRTFLQPQFTAHDIDDRYVDYNAQFLDDRLPQLKEFYRLVRARDESMVRNTLRVLGQYNARLTALITGGFHTQGISRRLRDAGVSYLVVAPNVEGELDYERYHALLGGADTPLPALLSPMMPSMLRVPLGGDTNGRFLAEGALMVSSHERQGLTSMAAASAVMLAIVTMSALWKKVLMGFLLVAVDSEGLGEVIAQLQMVDWSSLPEALALAQDPSGVVAVGEHVLEAPGQIAMLAPEQAGQFESVFTLGNDVAGTQAVANVRDSVGGVVSPVVDVSVGIGTAAVVPGLSGARSSDGSAEANDPMRTAAATRAAEEGVAKLRAQLRLADSLDAQLHFLIPHLLPQGRWEYLQEMSARHRATRHDGEHFDPEGMRGWAVAWYSRLWLFELFDAVGDGRPDIIRQALAIADEFDHEQDIEQLGYAHVVRNLGEQGYWAEWHRRLSLAELRSVAKYRRFFNTAGYHTFVDLGVHPMPDGARLRSLDARLGLHPDSSVMLVMRTPNFYVERSDYGFGLPHRGDERLPDGYVENLRDAGRTGFQILEQDHELAELDASYIDIEASRWINRQAEARGRIDAAMLQDIEELLDELAEGHTSSNGSVVRLAAALAPEAAGQASTVRLPETLATIIVFVGTLLAQDIDGVEFVQHLQEADLDTWLRFVEEFAGRVTPTVTGADVVYWEGGAEHVLQVAQDGSVSAAASSAVDESMGSGTEPQLTAPTTLAMTGGGVLGPGQPRPDQDGGGNGRDDASKIRARLQQIWPGLVEGRMPSDREIRVTLERLGQERRRLHVTFDASLEGRSESAKGFRVSFQGQILGFVPWSPPQGQAGIQVARNEIAMIPEVIRKVGALGAGRIQSPVRTARAQLSLPAQAAMQQMIRRVVQIRRGGEAIDLPLLRMDIEGWLELDRQKRQSIIPPTTEIPSVTPPLAADAVDVLMQVVWHLQQALARAEALDLGIFRLEEDGRVAFAQHGEHFEQFATRTWATALEHIDAPTASSATQSVMDAWDAAITFYHGLPKAIGVGAQGTREQSEMFINYLEEYFTRLAPDHIRRWRHAQSRRALELNAIDDAVMHETMVEWDRAIEDYREGDGQLLSDEPNTPGHAAQWIEFLRMRYGVLNQRRETPIIVVARDTEPSAVLQMALNQYGYKPYIVVMGEATGGSSDTAELRSHALATFFDEVTKLQAETDGTFSISSATPVAIFGDVPDMEDVVERFVDTEVPLVMVGSGAREMASQWGIPVAVGDWTTPDAKFAVARGLGHSLNRLLHGVPSQPVEHWSRRRPVRPFERVQNRQETSTWAREFVARDPGAWVGVGQLADATTLARATHPGVVDAMMSWMAWRSNVMLQQYVSPDQGRVWRHGDHALAVALSSEVSMSQANDIRRALQAAVATHVSEVTDQSLALRGRFGWAPVEVEVADDDLGTVVAVLQEDFGDAFVGLFQSPDGWFLAFDRQPDTPADTSLERALHVANRVLAKNHLAASIRSTGEPAVLLDVPPLTLALDRSDRAAGGRFDAAPAIEAAPLERRLDRALVRATRLHDVATQQLGLSGSVGAELPDDALQAFMSTTGPVELRGEPRLPRVVEAEQEGGVVHLAEQLHDPWARAWRVEALTSPNGITSQLLKQGDVTLMVLEPQFWSAGSAEALQAQNDLRERPPDEAWMGWSTFSNTLDNWAMDTWVMQQLTSVLSVQLRVPEFQQHFTNVHVVRGTEGQLIVVARSPTAEVVDWQEEVQMWLDQTAEIMGERLSAGADQLSVWVRLNASMVSSTTGDAANEPATLLETAQQLARLPERTAGAAFPFLVLDEKLLGATTRRGGQIRLYAPVRSDKDFARALQGMAATERTEARRALSEAEPMWAARHVERQQRAADDGDGPWQVSLRASNSHGVEVVGVVEGLHPAAGHVLRDALYEELQTARLHDRMSDHDVQQRLQEVLNRTVSGLRALAQADSAQADAMIVTTAFAVRVGDRVFIVDIGRIRIYAEQSDGTVVLMTKDDTDVQQAMTTHLLSAQVAAKRLSGAQMTAQLTADQPAPTVTDYVAVRALGGVAGDGLERLMVTTSGVVDRVVASAAASDDSNPYTAEHTVQSMVVAGQLSDADVAQVLMDQVTGLPTTDTVMVWRAPPPQTPHPLLGQRPVSADIDVALEAIRAQRDSLEIGAILTATDQLDRATPTEAPTIVQRLQIGLGTDYEQYRNLVGTQRRWQRLSGWLAAAAALGLAALVVGISSELGSTEPAMTVVADLSVESFDVAEDLSRATTDSFSAVSATLDQMEAIHQGAIEATADGRVSVSGLQEGVRQGFAVGPDGVTELPAAALPPTELVPTSAFTMAGIGVRRVGQWQGGVSAYWVGDEELREELRPDHPGFVQAHYTYVSQRVAEALQQAVDTGAASAPAMTTWPPRIDALARPGAAPFVVLTTQFVQRYLPTPEQLQVWVDQGLNVAVAAELDQQTVVRDWLGPDAAVITPAEAADLRARFPHLTILDPGLINDDTVRPIMDALGPRLMEAWLAGQVLAPHMIPVIRLDLMLESEIQRLQEQV